jgi:DNA-binding MarR family transcriptional regulator
MEKEKLKKLYEANLTSLGYKMYFYLCLRYSPDIWHVIQLAEIASYFDVNKSQSSRTVKAMIDVGLVKRRKTKDSRYEYMLSNCTKSYQALLGCFF